MPEVVNLSFSSIVLGTDLSTNVEGASRYAALLSQHYHAVLILVHAFTLEQPAMEVEALNRLPSMQRQELQQLLSETAKQLTPPARSSRTVLGQEGPVQLIRRVSQEHEPSLIVLGTHGAGALERHLIGSVAEAILRTVDNPVLTVGPRVKVPSLDKLVFRRILYATDFSLAAAQVAPYAFALAQDFESELDVLHVTPPDGDTRTEPEKTRGFRPGMEQLVPPEMKARLRSQIFVEFGEARHRIAEHAREQGVDLIVLGAHHHSPLSMHVRTGPAFNTILEAPCPVLTICA